MCKRICSGKLFFENNKKMSLTFTLAMENRNDNVFEKHILPIYVNCWVDQCTLQVSPWGSDGSLHVMRSELVRKLWSESVSMKMRPQLTTGVYRQWCSFCLNEHNQTIYIWLSVILKKNLLVCALRIWVTLLFFG